MTLMSPMGTNRMPAARDCRYMYFATMPVSKNLRAGKMRCNDRRRARVVGSPAMNGDSQLSTVQSWIDTQNAKDTRFYTSIIAFKDTVIRTSFWGTGTSTKNWTVSPQATLGTVAAGVYIPSISQHACYSGTNKGRSRTSCATTSKSSPFPPPGYTTTPNTQTSRISTQYSVPRCPNAQYHEQRPREETK